MTQIYTIEAASDQDLTDIQPDNHIREPEGPTEQFNPYRFETRLYYTDTTDRNAIETELSDRLQSEDWARVEYRHTTEEYDDPTYRDDAEYYHPVHELRTPPAIEWVEGYEVRVTWWGGEDTETLPEPSEFSETHTIERDGVALGDVTVKKPLDRIPRSGIDVRGYPDATAADEQVVSVGDRPERIGRDKQLHRIETAIDSTGPSGRGIAHRIDELEDRVSQLEGQ